MRAIAEVPRGSFRARTSAIGQPVDLIERFSVLVAGAYVVIAAVAPYMYGRYLVGPIAVAAVGLLVSGRRISAAGNVCVLALTALGVANTLMGSARGNPGARAMASVVVYEPFLLGVFFALLFSRASAQRAIVKWLDIAVVSVAVVGFLVYLQGSGGVLLPGWLVDRNHVAVDTSGTTLRTNYQGYNSLVFLAPYALARAARLRIPMSHLRRAALALAAISGLVLSGRRILYLSVPVSVVGVLLVAYLLARRTESTPGVRGGSIFGTAVAATISALGMSYVLNAVGLNIGDALGRVAGQFTLTDTTNVRSIETNLLLDQWSARPIFGQGSGAIVPGFVRDPTSPWSFEVSYHEILMDAGLLGLVVILMWGVWVGVRVMRADHNLPALAAPLAAGFVGAALSAYADPYFFKIDGMWMAMIPFGLAAAERVRAKPEVVK